MRLPLTLLLVTLCCGVGAYVAQTRLRPPPPPAAERVELLPQPPADPRGLPAFKELTVVPYDLPRYAFRIRVPADFRWRRFDLTRAERADDDKRPLPMAEFGPPATDPAQANRVLIEARYVRVPQHVPLARFVSVYAEQAGFGLVESLPRRYGGEDLHEALLHARSDELGDYYIRLSARRRGDLIFLCASSVVVNEYPAWRSTLAVVAASFTPTAAETR